jgi:hypothetical protein
MIVWTFGSLLAKSIHIVPAKLAYNMLELTGLAMEAEPHIEVRTTFIYMTI